MMSRRIDAIAILLFLFLCCSCGTGIKPDTISQQPETVGATEGIAEAAPGIAGAASDVAEAAPGIAEIPSVDDTIVLTITGDGVAEETEWTLNQMQAMQEGYREIIYSTTNNWPAFSHIEAHGVSLLYLLQQAGVMDDAACFTFISTDGYKAVLTREQLYDEHYSYTDHSAEGSAGPLIAEPLIAWAWGDVGNVREEAIRPFFGQSGSWDVNIASFVKNLCRIEISTVSPGAWEAPGAGISDGSIIPVGTGLMLTHENMDSVRIFYTLDGSEPGYDSPVFNRSTSYYQPQLIVPITLTGNVTIKAFAAGYGKDRSPVISLHYVVGKEGQTAFSFLFFSDTQADPDTGDYQAMGEMIRQSIFDQGFTSGQPASLAVFGGDTVNDGGDEDEWVAFWREAGHCRSLITAAAAGNHDNAALLASQFDYPVTASTNQGDGFFYSFDWGKIHISVLDSNIMGAARQTDADWLRDDLESDAARQADWRIAVMHHPMWLVSENPKDSARAEAMRKLFLPLLEEYGIDLILCGHQHNYARSLPMRGDAVSADGHGIVQIMAASGGKDSYAVDIADYIAVSADAPNYLLVTVEFDTLTIAAFDAVGRCFDSYTLMR
ncbi:MAG: metallophosphoesterase [Peptococcaceae bacterium]|jgi:hypothetical protein|nr:metallophosphoesterase [Peptococcaceae bacterium]